MKFNLSVSFNATEENERGKINVSTQWLNSAGTAFRNCMCLATLAFHQEIAVPPPEVVAPPHGQLIFVKIITIIATIGHILRIKCNEFYFGWGSAPYPAGGAYNAPPDSLSGFKGLTSKSRGRRGEDGRGREETERGGNVEFYHLLLSNLTTKCFSNIWNFNICSSDDCT